MKAKLSERNPARVVKELSLHGYKNRPARGAHQMVKCRCGRAAAVVPMRPRDLPDGTLGRIVRLLSCSCMEVDDG